MPKLTITTPFGTFTRTTDREYSHIVIRKHATIERLEAEHAEYLARIAEWEANSRPDDRERYAIYRQRAAKSHAKAIEGAKAGQWIPVSWSGRRDLAERELRKHQSYSAGTGRVYRIIAIADYAN